ncbi:AgrD protein [Staphylococcus caprae M23864:W1]|uniref:AgrD n=1 Tax=Staphylococcus caprae TaxID=29380 RepID=Q8VSZ7_9STAP|nr:MULTISPECIES: cyclic lactone autoinducer peptide [Staphylococcus]AAL65818.1 AgrD [Staphylococcus caprae]AUD57872.1 AgrD [Staphylococcus caprae]EES42187.1 AgrD protein [Staphylococcus caprae M23864:W1]MBU5272884.1 cyclic lactone autoinducer peptide [Staphylococcus caprae]MDI0015401.1 cyclic lactone autoinducer peptide [Staphylococcus caprae]
MMQIINLLFKVITAVFEKIGFIAGYSTCSYYFDEPEVPKELLEIYKK